MGRIKNDGKGRLGGRAKGTPNKVTADLRGWISSILEDGRERFTASLEQLDPNEYIKVYVGLLGYIVPRKAPESEKASKEIGITNLVIKVENPEDEELLKQISEL